MAGDDRNDADYISRRADRHPVRYGSGPATVIAQSPALLAGRSLRDRFSVYSVSHGLVLVPLAFDPAGGGSVFSRPTIGTRPAHRVDGIFPFRSLLLFRDYPGRDPKRDPRPVQRRVSS